MPKFKTYQRPAPVNKGKWNTTPGRKSQLPVKAPSQDRSAAQPVILPPLEQLLGKQ